MKQGMILQLLLTMNGSYFTRITQTRKRIFPGALYTYVFTSFKRICLLGFIPKSFAYKAIV